MPRWIEAAKQDELAPGDRLCRTIEGASVALFNVEGKLHAIRNVCPHAGMPLDGGDLQGTIITCPFHGYTYDIASGRNVDFADDVPVDVLPVRVEAGNVEVDADALSPSP